MKYHKLLCCQPRLPCSPLRARLLGLPEVRWVHSSLRISALEHLHLGRKIWLLHSYHLSYHWAESLMCCYWWSFSTGLPVYGSCSWFHRLLVVLNYCYLKPWQNTGALQPVSFVLWAQVDLKWQIAVDQPSFSFILFCHSAASNRSHFWGRTCIKERAVI